MTREEALQAIKAKIDYYESDKRLRVAIETLIPELAESEDERIRKEIIEYLWDISNQTPLVKESLDCRRWIAYLEKLKEQKSYSLIYDKDLDKAAREYYLSGGAASPVDSTGLVPIVRMAEFGATWMKERMEKEQKPVDLPAGFYVTLPDGKKYYAKEMRCNGMNVKVVEPKPVEWNANDKAFIKDCAHILDENGYEASAERLLSMFESKPVEWSEEDDKMLQNIIQEIEWERRNTTVDKDIRNYDRQLNFLKSLPMRCPKSSDNWKPSEVQMSMLLAVINDPNNAGAESCQLALRDLYQDLKKLM